MSKSISQLNQELHALLSYPPKKELCLRFKYEVHDITGAVTTSAVCNFKPMFDALQQKLTEAINSGANVEEPRPEWQTLYDEFMEQSNLREAEVVYSGTGILSSFVDSDGNRHCFRPDKIVKVVIKPVW